MDTNAKILDPIKKSSILPKLMEELNWFWHDEQLRRKEFYEWLTPNIKAEWIEGEIIMHSPVNFAHNKVTGNLFFLLKHFTFIKQKNDYVGIEKILTRFTRNDYEPDICYFSEAKAEKFKSDQNIFPVPDFIVEVVSKSSVKIDREIKFEDYELHQVSEYWIIDPMLETIEQYVLKNGKYELQTIENDTIESAVVKGFHIPLKAIFDNKEHQKWLSEL